MASFQSFLHVGGKKYEIFYSDLFLGQTVDSLGRPASLTLGGIFTVEINMPGSDDPVLANWMVSPTKILSGKVVLKRLDTNATLKVIKFYNAFCVGMDVHFDGTANASFFKVTLRISPEQIDIGGLLHDNKWPDETPIREIADEDSPKDPGLLSDIAHGVLDVAGMIPVVGELADGANALFYLAEGNKTDAALSAASMIPIAGWAATGAKVVRKGMKIAGKAKAIQKVTSKVNRAATATKAAVKRAEQIATKNLPDARILDRQISQADYDKLRSKTPSKKIQDSIQKDFIEGMPDEALPGKVVKGRFQADHIVSMDQITKMDGFGKLTPKQQLEVLNNPENFKGLSEAANKSKGKKTYEEWSKYEKENIDVDPVFKEKMTKVEKENMKKLQKQIDDLLNSSNNTNP